MDDGIQHDAIWLYRTPMGTHGPVTAGAIADKWIGGSLNAGSEVARLGTNFAPLGQVAALAHVAPQASLALARRERRRLMRRAAAAAALVAVALAGTAWVLRREVTQRQSQMQLERAARRRAADVAAAAQAQARAEADRQGVLARAAAHNMQLVPLVSLTALQDIRIDAAPAAPHTHRSHRLRRRAAGTTPQPGGEDDDLVEACQLTQGDVFATLRGELAKINVCVEDEKRRDIAKLLPQVLKMQFTVRTSGNVVEFLIDDARLRQGPLNNCMVRAFKTIHFPARRGADCPVTIPIKIRA